MAKILNILPTLSWSFFSHSYISLHLLICSCVQLSNDLSRGRAPIHPFDNSGVGTFLSLLSCFLFWLPLKSEYNLTSWLGRSGALDNAYLIFFKFSIAAALFGPVKVHKKCVNLCQNWPKFCVLQTTNYASFENIARIANAVQVTICLLVSTSVY